MAIPRVKDTTLFVQVFARVVGAGYAVGVIKARSYFHECAVDNVEGASWVGRKLFTGMEFVVVAGADVAEAETVVVVAAMKSPFWRGCAVRQPR